jgi:N-acyl homoserine lactone hydrolase
VRIDDVVRVNFGSFVRPAQETGSGAPRVEHVLGYLARTPTGLLLVDTGIGEADAETEAWYRPRRVPLHHALATAGVGVDDVALVVNCHLHFDHIGGNRRLTGSTVVCQRRELETARAGDYTVIELLDVPSTRWALVDGEAELAPGVLVIPTPGHVEGHQSVVLRCDDGTVIIAGQAHDTASDWSADALAARAADLGHEPPLPVASAWMPRLLSFDPRRVMFAHDAAVWTP